MLYMEWYEVSIVEREKYRNENNKKKLTSQAMKSLLLVTFW